MQRKFSDINKMKIFNDPVYGFIHIPHELVFDIVEHPWFQRLRRIRQLGLTYLVFPGALHTRFQHSMGAMHLMNEAIGVLRAKGHHITDKEALGACIAILLHDCGHGPFSHALERTIITGASHEELSLAFMNKLNKEYDNNLETAIRIFSDTYPKKFLHQLVSSQLDADRLDYLKRDSFFTGVWEGVIGTERIIQMFNVANDNLVVDIKGILSIEKFIVSRRLMYWQVYLHKTVLAAEYMLLKILKRAQYVYRQGASIYAPPALEFFLSGNYTAEDFHSDERLLARFALLDDYDLLSSIKIWMDHPDKILSFLSSSLVNRQLFRCEMQPEPFDYFRVEKIMQETVKYFGITEDEAGYFIYSDITSNHAYSKDSDQINILHKNEKITDLAVASDHLNLTALTKETTRHFICYPKQVEGRI